MGTMGKRWESMSSFNFPSRIIYVETKDTIKEAVESHCNMVSATAAFSIALIEIRTQNFLLAHCAHTHTHTHKVTLYENGIFNS